MKHGNRLAKLVVTLALLLLAGGTYRLMADAWPDSGGGDDCGTYSLWPASLDFNGSDGGSTLYDVATTWCQQEMGLESVGNYCWWTASGDEYTMYYELTFECSDDNGYNYSFNCDEETCWSDGH